MTTTEEFESYLKAPEAARLEFKEAKGSFHFDKFIQYIVALANEGGGKIILGVTDKRPRRVVGTQAFPEPGRTEAGVFERLGRRVVIEEFFYDGHRILIVHVPPRAPGTIWEDKGVAWSRTGDALVPMSDDQRRAIHLEAGPDFSAEVCPKATIDDLDPTAIGDFRRRWAKKAQNDRILNWSDHQTLAAAELLCDGQLTFAALILFGKHRAVGRHLAQAEIVFEYRSSEAAGPAQDRVEFREGFFLFHDRLWERINLRNDKQSYQDGFFRFDIPTFDEQPVREALLNAVCHRDYRLGSSVFVRQFSRRLEVISPGGLPIGVTVYNILDEQNPRNRRLADAFSRCGLVERAGQGMNLMFERAIRQSKPVPDFTGSAAHKVCVTLHGTIHDPAFVRFLEKIGQETLANFSTRDFLILDFIHREQAVPESLKPRLLQLRDQGVIESVGRGRGTRYLLSRRFYAERGRPGDYTRRRGLDHETNKALLCRHLAENKGGCPVSELQHVLPSLSRRAIQRLLEDLRSEGHARLAGAGRGARWFQIPEGDNPDSKKRK